MRVEGLDVSAFTIPTDAPESDGTNEWESTTVVVVEARSGTVRGLGWTYAGEAAGRVVEELLAPVALGRSLDDLARTWLDCGAALRNAGRPGIAFCALSAVDIALWDLRARLLGVSLTSLLPRAHDRVPVYGFFNEARTRFCQMNDPGAPIPRIGSSANQLPCFEPVDRCRN